jgi:putative membrane protein
MSMKTAKTKRSVRKGFLAGVAGGMAGAGAWAAAGYLFPRRLEGVTPPSPMSLAEPAEATGRKRTAPGTALALAALAGGIYGAMVEYQPSLAAWRGAAFGVGLKRMSQETLLPKAGPGAMASDQPTQERISRWMTHVAYGVTTELVRRRVRRGL